MLIFSETVKTGLKIRELVQFPRSDGITFLLNAPVTAEESHVWHRHDDALRPRVGHCGNLVRQEHFRRLRRKSNLGA